MTDMKILKKMDYEDFEKPDGMELVFIPKEEFLEWYKQSKGVEDVKMEKKEVNGKHQNCPNCKSSMQSYKIESTTNNELWHFCSKCNLTFSERQHDYFTMMILQLLNGSDEIKKEL